jgi:hypothetical protein
MTHLLALSDFYILLTSIIPITCSGTRLSYFFSSYILLSQSYPFALSDAATRYDHEYQKGRSAGLDEATGRSLVMDVFEVVYATIYPYDLAAMKNIWRHCCVYYRLLSITR